MSWDHLFNFISLCLVFKCFFIFKIQLCVKEFRGHLFHLRFNFLLTNSPQFLAIPSLEFLRGSFRAERGTVSFFSNGRQIALKVFKAVLSVKDSGAGLDPEHLPYVFDRFYRVDQDRNRKTGGSGLGLAITQALVVAHGGTIMAASEGKDQGSEFTIQFPL